MTTDNPRAAYVHVPFCRAKCFYCDFNSYPGQEKLFDDYVDAVIIEICAAPAGLPLDSVYFGGGTPTVLTPGALGSLVRAIRDRFGISEGAEVTVEANPGTVSMDSLSRLRSDGFNRLSIGVQSFDDGILSRIGRIHTANEARESLRSGRDAGFDNISVDLMYALPGQSLSDWRSTLTSAIELAPEHISLYELTVEEGTVFGNLRKKCQLRLPDEDAQVDMYTAAIDMLVASGYEHYEISNFALPGRRSRHNQVYWRNEPYFGFGAGASGYVGGVRYTNVRPISDYIEIVRTTGRAVESSESLTGRQLMGETVMLGLRMLDGINLEDFERRFDVSLAAAYPEELERLIGDGLVEIAGMYLRLSGKGLLVANEVAQEFL